MQKLLWLLALVLAPSALAYTANSSYPTFGHCNQKIISAIKLYWGITGPPSNSLKKLEEGGQFALLHTSYDFNNADNKCIYVKVKDDIMKVIFPPKNGEAAANLTWKIEQGPDGVIKGRKAENDTPEYRWNWIPVYFDNGIHVCYICSDAEGSPELPLLDIMISENSAANIVSSTIINNLHSLAKGWGIDFKYSYGSECLAKKEAKPLTGLIGGLVG